MDEDPSSETAPVPCIEQPFSVLSDTESQTGMMDVTEHSVENFGEMLRHSIPENASRNAYQDWPQVAGYFDGDGCVDFNLGKWVLHPNLHFSDNYRPHLEMLKDFLLVRNVTTQVLTKCTGGAWKFGAGAAESVYRMACNMWPYCFKKKEELKAIIDYLDNRITGSQFVHVLNESVRLGNRTGKIRVVNIPYTREGGRAMRYEERAENVRKMIMRNKGLNDEVLEQIRLMLISGKATNKELSDQYHVSAATISRAVFGRTDEGGHE